MILGSSVKIRSVAAPGLSSEGFLPRSCKSPASRVDGCRAGVAAGVAAGDAGVAMGAIAIGGNGLKSIEVTATDSCGGVSPTIGGIVPVVG